MADFSAVRRRVAVLRELRPSTIEGFSARVAEVVIVASSSRGGSSVFTEMLRHSPELIHFRAEVNPFLILAGLGFPESGGSDALGSDAGGDRQTLDAELALDAGGWAPLTPDSMPDSLRAFALDLAWRLTVQWPTLDIEPERVVRWTQKTLEAHSLQDLAGFHLALLRKARSVYPTIDPWYYDIDPQRIRLAFPKLIPPLGAPGPVVLEEPPFVLVQPWRHATVTELSSRPLIIKTPSNAYRLPFLRALFPNARLRILHLTRNPAAAVNGLHDGWRFRGFHAHRVGGLAIPGYSDTVPGGDAWWKYDLAPGWQDWTQAPLEEVCGFQWRSAHQHVLDWADSERPDLLRIRFEDVVGERADRRRAWSQVSEWLGLDLGSGLANIVEHGIPPVMATHAPRRRRWFAKAELLEPVLADPRTIHVAKALGYGERKDWV
jgi:hypothetical protein